MRAAQELLQENKVRARRRTIEPSLVQGLVSCRKCGYALSRTSTRSSARKISYYRCIGSDAWRHLGGPRCDNRPMRQDLLDQIVWTEVMRLLEDPALIQQELDRRLAAAQAADPMKTRTQTVERDLARVRKSIERLLTAYQEDLVSLEQLRDRMPQLRQRDQTLQRELDAIAAQTRDRAAYLRLAETLSAFLARLRDAADTLDITERQRIVRLVVKEVLVDEETIVIRHSVPVPSGPPSGGSGPPTREADDAADHRSYLLRTGREYGALWGRDYRATANDNIMIIAMIEQPDGVARAAEIAGVPGVDVVFVASSDLGSFSGKRQGDPEYEALVTTFHDDTLGAGQMLGGPSAWRNRDGFPFFQGPGTTSLIRSGARASLEAASGVAPIEGTAPQR